MGKIESFDLAKHFAFFGARHTNPVNILIHMFFVWPNFFIALLLFHFIPPLLKFSQLGLALDFAFFYALIHAVSYVYVDKKAGSLGALLCFGCWAPATSLANRLGFSLAWKVVLATMIFNWIAHVIGHKVFEKRDRAHVDNLALYFLMAPFFVLLKALGMFFDYEPYPGFHARVKELVEADIKEWQENKEKKTY